MISLKNFDLSINGELLIEESTIDFIDGSFNVILGENGTGKSSFIRSIYSLKSSQSNKIFIDGISVEEMNKQKINQLKRSIGIVEQFPILFRYLKVKENIGYRLKLLGLKKPDIDSKVNEISELLGIQDILESFPEKISGGQLQRVSIAMNLITEGKYLFLDEPTANLDEANSLKVINLCLELKKNKSTIFFITHDTNIIDYLKSLDINMYELHDKKLVEYEH